MARQTPTVAATAAAAIAGPFGIAGARRRATTAVTTTMTTTHSQAKAIDRSDCAMNPKSSPTAAQLNGGPD